MLRFDPMAPLGLFSAFLRAAAAVFEVPHDRNRHADIDFTLARVDETLREGVLRA